VTGLLTTETTVVLEASGMLRASEKSVVEAAIGRRPGVREVEANPVSQTATVTYDPRETSIDELRDWIEECGYHCAGESVPEQISELMPPPRGEDALRSPDEVMGHRGFGTRRAARLSIDGRRPELT
jgi:P-type Cu2+ transporter